MRQFEDIDRMEQVPISGTCSQRLKVTHSMKLLLCTLNSFPQAHKKTWQNAGAYGTS